MDDAEYIVLAKSILSSPEYGLVNGPDSVMSTRYPFGWPLLLAPIYQLTAGNLQSLKLISLIATLVNIVFIALAWRWLGLRKAWIGLVSGGIYAFLPVTIDHSSMVMSEAVFLTVVLACIALTTYLVDTRRHLTINSVVLGIVLVFVLYIRTIGITAAIGCLLYILWHRQWRIAGLCGFGFVTWLSIIVLLTSVSLTDIFNVGVYQTQLTDSIAPTGQGAAMEMISSAMEGASSYARAHVRDALIPYVGGSTTHAIMGRIGLGWVPDMFSVILVLLISIGFAVTWQLKMQPSHPYILLYCAVLLIWPWRGERFLYPVLPFLIAYLLVASSLLISYFAGLASSISDAATRTIQFVSAALLILWVVALLSRADLTRDSTDYVLDLRIGTNWISQNTPVDAIVSAEQTNAAYLYANRPTVPLTTDRQTIRRLACERPMFVVVAPPLVWGNTRLLEPSPAAVQMIHAAQGAELATEIVFEDTASGIKVVHIHGMCP